MNSWLHILCQVTVFTNWAYNRKFDGKKKSSVSLAWQSSFSSRDLYREYEGEKEHNPEELQKLVKMKPTDVAPKDD